MQISKKFLKVPSEVSKKISCVNNNVKYYFLIKQLSNSPIVPSRSRKDPVSPHSGGGVALWTTEGTGQGPQRWVGALPDPPTLSSASNAWEPRKFFSLHPSLEYSASGHLALWSCPLGWPCWRRAPTVKALRAEDIHHCDKRPESVRGGGGGGG